MRPMMALPDTQHPAQSHDNAERNPRRKLQKQDNEQAGIQRRLAPAFPQ
jgi:hypothetical protein